MFKIYGHKNILALFNKIVSSQKIANAYLFIGESGFGKEFMAKYFAMMINCKNGSKPCLSCPSCIQMISGNHPDIFFIEPDGISIKVETLRNVVINNAYVKPYNSYKKIFIIKEAEKMTEQAQNSILKTLEEPPEYGLFILTSSKMEGLLPTIVSRCEIIRFTRESDEVIEDYLINEKKIDRSKAKKIASIANGNYGKANLLIDEDYSRIRSELGDILYNVINQDKALRLESFKFFDENREMIDDIIDIMFSYLRDLMILKLLGSEEYIINKDMVDKLKDFSGNLTGFKLNNIINEIEELAFNLKSNVNYQLAIEKFLLNI
ncbi:DNA polymerase III subunit delta' [Thermoanaerobacterium thermosaccharolyticum]|uniref:DNA polymerase III subunit delta' n=1 Tax=Thermoanaerobacterium thermosaccharolyticum TaxID=1517 RepID=UPI00123B6A51|nr:DNA polymerase III subunit delta' [Thermoanaerobacterium thermosaccharolyticum]KAA5806054.1 DNA polymerase III subunit delta' [Thermoanaerobacterium thermosaccharolyticum]MBE0067526.1 DNA polymerase III subunit delta' [Thermoanaerobacterium thermosaccharolyticum]MBE0227058.1 DNA polymerase III subunit delta' [Thermoanaerobacterium thermosaccharolyticum]